MPVMNGFDFLIQIKKENHLDKIPLDIFTTSNNLRDKEMANKFGAQFFLTKPNQTTSTCFVKNWNKFYQQIFQQVRQTINQTTFWGNSKFR